MHDYRLKERTYSLWAHLLSEKQNYLNPVYSPSFAESHPVLLPSTQAYHFKYRCPSTSHYKTRFLQTVMFQLNDLCCRFWRNMYHQYDRSMHPRQSILKHILTLKESNRELEGTVRALKAVSLPQEFVHFWVTGHKPCVLKTNFISHGCFVFEKPSQVFPQDSKDLGRSWCNS